jgi:hypothetical protein
MYPTLILKGKQNIEWILMARLSSDCTSLCHQPSFLTWRAEHRPIPISQNQIDQCPRNSHSPDLPAHAASSETASRLLFLITARIVRCFQAI